MKSISRYSIFNNLVLMIIFLTFIHNHPNCRYKKKKMITKFKRSWNKKKKKRKGKIFILFLYLQQ